MTRAHSDSTENQHLDDEDLLRREGSEEREYHRLWDRERRVSQTTYKVFPGSRLLLHAWERWTRTQVAARLRGLTQSK